MTDPARSVGHHFDAWAPSYDAQIREMVPRYEEIHDTLLALLALRAPERFLDLGSGTGYTLRRVLEAFPSAPLLGPLGSTSRRRCSTVHANASRGSSPASSCG